MIRAKTHTWPKIGFNSSLNLRKWELLLHLLYGCVFGNPLQKAHKLQDPSEVGYPRGPSTPEAFRINLSNRICVSATRPPASETHIPDRALPLELLTLMNPCDAGLICELRRLNNSSFKQRYHSSIDFLFTKLGPSDSGSSLTAQKRCCTNFTPRKFLGFLIKMILNWCCFAAVSDVSEHVS